VTSTGAAAAAADGATLGDGATLDADARVAAALVDGSGGIDSGDDEDEDEDEEGAPLQPSARSAIAVTRCAGPTSFVSRPTGPG
jgi:hypothetical protein